MEWFALLGIGLLTVFLAQILKTYHRPYSLLVILAGGTVILFQVILQGIPLFTRMQDWLLRSGLDGDSFGVLLKAIGICILTQFASDICRDAGESALASKLELAGKCTVLLLALPLFETTIERILSLTGGGS